MLSNKKTIGERIKTLREEKGETQADIAKELCVKRETVNQWENGTRDLKTEYTIKLSNYFETTCDYILRGIESENVNIHRKTGLTDEAIELLKFYNNGESHGFSDEQGKKAMLNTINLLLENENKYHIIEAVYLYLSKFVRPKHQINPNLQGGWNDETRKEYFTQLETNIEVFDEFTNSLHMVRYEAINNSYLTIMQTQLSNLKEYIYKEKGINAEHNTTK